MVGARGWGEDNSAKSVGNGVVIGNNMVRMGRGWDSEGRIRTCGAGWG